MDTLAPKERSARMALVRSKGTKPEAAARRIVSALGYRYRLHRVTLPGKPDIAIGRERKAIFVNGCFWHMHRGCGRLPKSRLGYWLPKLRRNAERDREARTALRRMGWRSLVVWECELKHPGKAARKIGAFLRADS